MNAQKSGKEVGIATKLALPEIAHMLDQNECCKTVKKNLELSSYFMTRLFQHVNQFAVSRLWHNRLFFTNALYCGCSNCSHIKMITGDLDVQFVEAAKCAVEGCRYGAFERYR
jgi:hypothetical protein